MDIKMLEKLKDFESLWQRIKDRPGPEESEDCPPIRLMPKNVRPGCTRRHTPYSL